MKLKDKIIEIKVRIDSGNSLVYWLRNLIIMVAAIKYLIDLSVEASIILFFVLIFVLYFLGWVYLDILKFGQREQEIIYGKYNFYFKKLKKQVNRKV